MNLRQERVAISFTLKFNLIEILAICQKAPLIQQFLLKQFRNFIVCTYPFFYLPMTLGFLLYLTRLHHLRQIEGPDFLFYPPAPLITFFLPPLPPMGIPTLLLIMSEIFRLARQIQVVQHFLSDTLVRSVPRGINALEKKGPHPGTEILRANCAHGRQHLSSIQL